ncbi:MAG: hypothetical protein JOZ19_07465 [Rubrobacter sp.]|nr:hypothetical protein [Rubrobacter sp.]
MELPEGYKLGEAENDVQVLKRPGGYALAAFGRGVNPENIRRVAEADKRYLEAKELDNKFGLGGDPESAFLFAEDVREAREKYLLALEAAYRE